ncbi:hypothetical protein DOTSEDRAFT_71348 [Dothistroma septosporum NZE10]|uniref:tripeptidyl-peptidase II n=1 Tax=Dothistroma septosporum (strain NZE10 / CBS 128990) TaxID=675120 RepID=N1PRR5_DOTSN|nr:hypothetical protein DOTSEDRAFT_71348 [Dothistroma septosporum NZE10]
MKQGSFSELERHLYEVSDPAHSRYGQHLAASDVHALTAPPAHALDAVHDWLGSSNIQLEQLEYTPAKDWIVVALPVSQVEELLDTEYHEYENADGDRIVRTPKYGLPKHLHDLIDVVAPTNYFSKPSKSEGNGHSDLKKRSSDSRIVDLDAEPAISRAQYLAINAAAASGSLSAVCNPERVTSLCLRTLYNTVDYTPKVPELNYVGTTNYLNETPIYSDFKIWLQKYRTDANPDYKYSYQVIDGGADNQSPNPDIVEANLDVQMVGGFVYPTKFTTYSTGGSAPYSPDLATPTDTNEPYLTWVNYVSTQPSVPFVVTTSYGDDEQTVPQNYATRVCAEFAALGARGVTLLFSSGDNGVGADGTCVSNDGKNTTKFLPAFPASCPYITTVGGTRGINPEVVAYDTSNGYVAGGGFSNYFPTPAYQQVAVSSYLKSIGSLNKGLYNPNGRAYPDIAAQSYHFVITYNGTDGGVDGTSVASPAAAGVLTNVNDALLAAGRPPLGFLNPLIYSGVGAKGFNDVTQGSVTGCNTAGFPAKTSWDAASGWGTPDFKKIRSALGV